MLDGTPAWSRRHDQFSNNDDPFIREVSGLLDRDIHVEAVLLAQEEYLSDREGLNPSRWKTQGEGNR